MGEGQNMRRESTLKAGMGELPSWVPVSALHYLAHTESGTSIRALARRAGCHASTILRQVRNFEMRRDDLLIDQALRRLSCQVLGVTKTGSPTKEARMNGLKLPEADDSTLSEERLKSEARRILRHLCETGAVLAVSAEMDKAVVVRETAVGQSVRTGVVDREIAEAMALKDWISCGATGRIARYQITRTGRNALNHLLAEAENKSFGFADTQTMFTGPLSDTDETDDNDDSAERSKRVRYNMAETPLSALSRRKDRDGKPFLSFDLVRAGERLREDYELGQMGPQLAKNWDKFLTGSEEFSDDTLGSGSRAARARAIGAIRDLGPGLGDVALRCCCHLEGLERAEKRMGWSARSGKIVLRIALQRLKRHYEELGDDGGLIG